MARPGGRESFSPTNGGLADHPLTRGGAGYFPLDSVVTFTGQAFVPPDSAVSLLHCGPGWVLRLPRIAWRFTPATPTFGVAGWSQLALLPYGRGRVVVGGEAAMFSAQITEVDDVTSRAGMNAAAATQNYRLLLNLLRWLAAD